MPAGYVYTGQNKDGSSFIEVVMTGLTPGSAHWVDVFNGGQANPFGELTANSAGELQGSVNVPSIPADSQVWILGDGTNTNPIAMSSTLNATDPTFALHAFESGLPLGSLQGHATVVYDPAWQTIAVTLTASGLSPGAHAVDIYTGSCANQGSVLYKPADFTADSHGNITSQTRVATGVRLGMPSTGWYLMVHQGDGSSIVSGGQPTELYRPLFCASI